MLKLSIIIPVYNVEPYIAKCLDSCLQQDIPADEYEIIVVNDGSPDNSVVIVTDYIQRYPNLRLVSRENGGLSAARNTGLNEAQSDYIWFVDSDDTIADGALSAIFEGLKDNVDILGIQYRLVYDDETKNRDVCSSKVDGIRDGRYVTKQKGISIPVPFCVYRRQFLIDHNLKFAEGKLHEDSEFKPRAIYLADRIATIDYICYNYYKGNSSSITAKHSYRNVDGYMYAAESIDTFSKNATNVCKRYLYREVGRCVNGAIFSYVHLTERKERDKARKRILIHPSLFIHMIKTLSLSYAIEGLLLLLIPNFFLSIYPSLKKIK